MGEHTARVKQAIGADRERVWRAFTSPEELASWFWPPRFQTVATVDAVAGSAWSIRSAPTAMGASGVVTEAEEPSRLALTWQWDGEEEETRVTLELAEAGSGGTVLTVVHEGFDTAEAAADHVEGWEDCLTRLDALLDSQRTV
ncbi:SRPBCC family protein [Leifsonia lichenia]